ncbi:flagellar hook-basal body complex protein FliE [Blastococcus sp. TF02A-26]|uniref:flagellar hook-basal body complex protein FliE n=1 Tax=Blastococcus sp. TF02A-26 TaxID=2250577 RepID=UPI000DEA36F0|nr:flagellar hook-basal body complex protein FliE [Blastococcus sp. TF02A-26]RBY86061.1 flagellar hook-basal body complex protein FliE [Blastococcus sp. TF02A-26]
MTFPIGGISIPSFPTVPAVGGAGGIGGAAAATEAPAVSATENGFADVLTGAIENVQGAQSKSNELAVQAATGDLKDVHDYMIAAQEAALTTEMFVTLKNKAVEAFTEIMRMPI